MITKPRAGSTQTWEMELHDRFVKEFDALDPDVKKQLLVTAEAVGRVGPTASRPTVDALKNPPHPNMKEMRFECKNGNEVWRVAFAFDPNSVGIIFCAGDKQGKNSDLFYKNLLAKANKRFDQHLKAVQKAKAEAALQQRQAEKAAALAQATANRRRK